MLGITKHHSVSCYTSCWQCKRLMHRFPHFGRSCHESCPAGSQSKSRCCDVKMRKGNDGVRGCDWATFWNVGNQEMRSISAYWIHPVLPCSHQPDGISTHGTIAFGKGAHPINCDSCEPFYLLFIIYDHPLYRLCVHARCGIADDIQHLFDLLLFDLLGCEMSD